MSNIRPNAQRLMTQAPRPLADTTSAVVITCGVCSSHSTFKRSTGDKSAASLARDACMCRRRAWGESAAAASSCPAASAAASKPRKHAATEDDASGDEGSGRRKVCGSLTFDARKAKQRNAEPVSSEQVKACRAAGAAAMPCCRRREAPTTRVTRMDTK